MEENLLPIRPQYKLYKDNALYPATFIGGPLAGTYLIAENFRKLGRQEEAKKTWIIGIIATVIIFGTAYLLPDTFPGFIIPLTYAMVAGLLARKYQGNLITHHLDQGGSMHSNWRAALVGLIGLALTLALLFLIILVADPAFLALD